MYKCENCQKNFQSKKRNKRFSDKILKEYVWQRQTYCDLASKYNRSTKWIQRKLDETKVKKVVRINKKELVLVADVTFFTRTKGLSVFREPNLRKNVWWKQTKQENVDIYLQGKEHLEKNGFTIRAIVLDGKRGVREVFSNIPVQMCHFHQKQIVRRYLTLRPKLEASKELKQIVETLTKITEQLFTEELSNWYNQWETFLKEKATNKIIAIMTKIRPHKALLFNSSPITGPIELNLFSSIFTVSPRARELITPNLSSSVKSLVLKITPSPPAF